MIKATRNFELSPHYFYFTANGGLDVMTDGMLVATMAPDSVATAMRNGRSELDNFTEKVADRCQPQLDEPSLEGLRFWMNAWKRDRYSR